MCDGAITATAACVWAGSCVSVIVANEWQINKYLRVVFRGGCTFGQGAVAPPKISALPTLLFSLSGFKMSNLKLLQWRLCGVDV